jgi:hypothetical protein
MRRLPACRQNRVQTGTGPLCNARFLGREMRCRKTILPPGRNGVNLVNFRPAGKRFRFMPQQRGCYHHNHTRMDSEIGLSPPLTTMKTQSLALIPWLKSGRTATVQVLLI